MGSIPSMKFFKFFFYLSTYYSHVSEFSFANHKIRPVSKILNVLRNNHFKFFFLQKSRFNLNFN